MSRGYDTRLGPPSQTAPCRAIEARGEAWARDCGCGLRPGLWSARLLRLALQREVDRGSLADLGLCPDAPPVAERSGWVDASPVLDAVQGRRNLVLVFRGG